MSTYHGTSDADAMTVKCPKCAEPKGMPCVYVPVATASERWANGQMYGPTRARLDRVGTPTKRVHNERRQKFDAAGRSRRLKISREAYLTRVARVPAALWSLRAFDVAEYNQTKEWLRENGHILWGGNDELH